MYVTNSKRLTNEGSRKMMATAVEKAKEAGIAVSIAITNAVCAASSKRATSARGAQAQELDAAHALGLALAAGPERWTAMQGGCPVIADGECIGGIGVAGGGWGN